MRANERDEHGSDSSVSQRRESGISPWYDECGDARETEREMDER